MKDRDEERNYDIVEQAPIVQRVDTIKRQG